jgi:predicted permease
MMRLFQDLRYGGRMLRKTPSFTIVAVLSLALGIGANTTIFSLVDGLWTRPMAVPSPGDVVRVFSVTTQDADDGFSYPEYLELVKQTTAFNGLVARGGRGARIPNPDGTSELRTVNVVSENFFSVLGVSAMLGRTFIPADDRTALVVVLGNRFWKSRFGGDPAIVGKQIELTRGQQGVPFTVLGVLPETFRDIDNGGDRDLWLPPQSWVRLSGPNDFENRGYRWMRLLGRLRPGSSATSATAQVQMVAKRLAEAWPETNAGRSARVEPDLSYRLRQAGTNGLLLLSIVLLLVVLCSVNVANLLLARSASRAKEVSLRLSLGAQRLRVVRQLMTENLLLGLAGLAAGLTIGAWLIRLLPSLLVQPPAMFQPVMDFRLDSRVLGFTMLVSLITVVLFGLTPAWRTSKTSLVPARTQRGLRLRHWLVVSQVSVSLTLLAATGVLVRSFVNTRTLDFGLARKPLLLEWVMSQEKQAPMQYREALDRLRNFPGVKEVALASRAPLSLSEGGMSQLVSFPDLAAMRNQSPIEIKYNSVSSNYFRLMGTALRRGRVFDEADQTNGPLAAVINENMAQRFWPAEDPLDKTIRLEGPQGGVYRIVGVVQNAPINAVGEAPEPYLYLPYWRNFTIYATFIIHTDGDALALAQPVRRKLIELNRQLDPLMINTEEELIHYSAGGYQITAELVAALGFLGLMLTAVGLYGVVSYGVNQRTREIGIRMALGAERNDTLRLVLREVGLLGVVGLILGIPMALAATRLASSLLFGVGPWDIRIFLGSSLLLAAVLLVAGFGPARRATRVDPMVALRYE